MQRKFFFLVYLFFCTKCCCQQLPFVYYTPREGLINSRVRNVLQDSSGRMFFLTYGGFSIYDGTKFFSYNVQSGLSNDLVNDALEMGNDSFWIACNDHHLNILSHGRIKQLATSTDFSPIINKFLKTKDGTIYAAADEGLYRWKSGIGFEHISIKDKNKEELLYFSNMVEYNGWLLLSQWVGPQTKHLVAVNLSNNKIYSVCYQPGYDIKVKNNNTAWVSLPNGFMEVDNEKLQQHILDLNPLPAQVGLTGASPGSFCFDKAFNTWINYGSSLLKITAAGVKETISREQGLRSININTTFFDREGILWIGTDGNGVMKLTGTNLRLLNNFNGATASSIEALTAYKNSDTVWMYDLPTHQIICTDPSGSKAFPFTVDKSVHKIFKKENALYISCQKDIYLIQDCREPSAYQHAVNIFHTDSGYLSRGISDPYGNIIEIYAITDSSFYLHSLVNGKTSSYTKIPFLVDQLVVDSQQRLWAATRNNRLMVYQLDAEHPSHYLQLLKEFDSKELPDISPRSICMDKKNNLWLGTRLNGVFKFELNGLNIIKQQQFTMQQGLVDNFIVTLHCDNNNHIWAGTQNGMDEIMENGKDTKIKNITKSQNIFLFISNIFSDKKNTVWALSTNGSVIKIAEKDTGLSSTGPAFFFNELKVSGKETAIEPGHTFSSGNNNLSFSVAATSFMDEKQIRYSYLLKGSGNNNWSEPVNNAVFNFINLAPGKYILQVRADFPDELYPSSMISYSFSISKPWWLRWWFISIIVLAATLLLYFIIRNYYRRKMGQQKMIYEKQQAVEQERSRIATDMHDDLGAGLTRIKFLSENISERNITGNDREELQKLQGSANELIESMGEIIWAMNDKNNTLEDLIFHLRSYSITYCEENKLNCSFNLAGSIPYQNINGHTRRNIFLIVKECLHNIVKHAAAGSVIFNITAGESLVISIQDNGKGMSNGNSGRGNGLINMQKRITEMKGSFTIINNNGTKTELRIPMTV